jgi:hypothetical protein
MLDHTQYIRPDQFVFVEQPVPLISALFSGEWLEISETVFPPAFNNGLAKLTELGLSGYVWRYLQEGQQVYEQSNLWFMLLGYNAPPETITKYKKYQADVQALCTGYTEDFDFVPVTVAAGITAYTAVYRNQAVQSIAPGLRDLKMRGLLELGNIRTPSLIMSTTTCPHPFTWAEVDNLEIPVC